MESDQNRRLRLDRFEFGLLSYLESPIIPIRVAPFSRVPQVDY